MAYVIDTPRLKLRNKSRTKIKIFVWRCGAKAVSDPALKEENISDISRSRVKSAMVEGGPQNMTAV